jgi:hypothetical protein
MAPAPEGLPETEKGAEDAPQEHADHDAIAQAQHSATASIFTLFLVRVIRLIEPE